MKFHLNQIFIGMTLAIALLAATMLIVGPTLKLASSIREAKNTVKHRLDHISIRNAAIAMLDSGLEGMIDDADLPREIAQSDPKFVHVAYDCVTIEYGGGFAHYGLIVDPSGQHVSKMPSLPPGVQHDELDLGNGVFFYESD